MLSFQFYYHPRQGTCWCITRIGSHRGILDDKPSSLTPRGTLLHTATSAYLGGARRLCQGEWLVPGLSVEKLELELIPARYYSSELLQTSHFEKINVLQNQLCLDDIQESSYLKCCVVLMRWMLASNLYFIWQGFQWGANIRILSLEFPEACYTSIASFPLNSTPIHKIRPQLLYNSSYSHHLLIIF